MDAAPSWQQLVTKEMCQKNSFAVIAIAMITISSFVTLRVSELKLTFFSIICMADISMKTSILENFYFLTYFRCTLTRISNCLIYPIPLLKLPHRRGCSTCLI